MTLDLRDDTDTEADLSIQGLVAIEDRLGFGVKEAVEALRDASLKIWVLTGDKIQTAIAVARSAGITGTTSALQEGTDQTAVVPWPHCVLQGASARHAERGLQTLRQFWLKLGDDKGDAACVMTGDVLRRMLSSFDPSRKTPLLRRKGADEGAELHARRRQELRKQLLRFSAVILCRVSPKQKREVVEFLQEPAPLLKMRSKSKPAKSPKSVESQLPKAEPERQLRVLAIGDGANDSDMIRQANIGVGLFGLEGDPAARAADVAVPHFACLPRLIFVHGREAHRKNATLVQYMLYKNVAATVIFAIYGVACGLCSGVMFVNQWTYTLYNVLFAAFPIGFWCVFDRGAQDVRELLGREIEGDDSCTPARADLSRSDSDLEQEESRDIVVGTASLVDNRSDICVIGDGAEEPAPVAVASNQGEGDNSRKGEHEAKPPHPYAPALAGSYISQRQIVYWLSLSVYQMSLVHWACWNILGNAIGEDWFQEAEVDPLTGDPVPAGQASVDYFATGQIVYGLVILIVNIQILCEQSRVIAYGMLTVLSVVISVAAYGLTFLLVYDTTADVFETAFNRASHVGLPVDPAAASSVSTSTSSIPGAALYGQFSNLLSSCGVVRACPMQIFLTCFLVVLCAFIGPFAFCQAWGFCAWRWTARSQEETAARIAKLSANAR